jgi:hypothetical protein
MQVVAPDSCGAGESAAVFSIEANKSGSALVRRCGASVVPVLRWGALARADFSYSLDGANWSPRLVLPAAGGADRRPDAVDAPFVRFRLIDPATRPRSFVVRVGGATADLASASDGPTPPPSAP